MYIFDENIVLYLRNDDLQSSLDIENYLIFQNFINIPLIDHICILKSIFTKILSK